MKKQLKKRIVSIVSIILVTTVLSVSGPSLLVASILGGTTIYFLPKTISLNNDESNKNKKNKDNKSITPETKIDVDEIYFTETETETEEKNVSFSINEENKYSYEFNLLDRLVTTDALTESEKVNQLVRKRKKQTITRISKNNFK